MAEQRKDQNGKEQSGQMKAKKRLTVEEVRRLPKDAAFSLLGVASRLVRKRDKNDNPFWDISVMDGTGQVDGKIWGNSEWWDLEGEGKVRLDPLADAAALGLEGCTVGLQGKVVEFRDQNQYNFNVVYRVDQEKYPPHGFVRRSPFSDEAMEVEFRERIEGCGEPVRGFLAAIFFERNLWREYRAWPAAVSVHHAYVGGLLEHSLSVTRSAAVLARSYAASGMPVDPDIVVAGALLHDLGKLESYRLSPTPQMTLPGNVVDHIVLGYHRFMSLVEEEDFDRERALAIGHILVSHHGSREFGSPVLPATSEAMIVSAADELDFKLYCWREQVVQLDTGRDVTDFVPALQRRLWRGSASASASAALRDGKGAANLGDEP